MINYGRFIVIYGVNGIGKSVQVTRLVKYLKSLGIDAHDIKYPIYNLEPEGPFIYKYLRDEDFRLANPRTTHELQYLYMLNRQRYELTLLERLNRGEWIIAEDYTGTSFAWGQVYGGDLAYLEEINKHLKQADLSILLTGKRFLTAIEEGHRNENNGEALEKTGKFLEELADKYHWHKIEANDTIENVHRAIVSLLELPSSKD